MINLESKHQLKVLEKANEIATSDIKSITAQSCFTVSDLHHLKFLANHMLQHYEDIARITTPKKSLLDKFRAKKLELELDRPMATA